MDPNHCHQTKEEKRLGMENKTKSLQGEVEASQPMSKPSLPSSSSSSSSSSPSSSSSTTSVAVVATSPPPSSSSSPSHDFTFTISLYPSPPKGPNKSPTKSRNPAKAIDLAPADDIFFHGHLLPLRLLTRPPFSPRRTAENVTISFNKTSASILDADQQKPSKDPAEKASDAKERMKTSKSFPSLLTGLAKWRREVEKEEEEDDKDKATDKDKDKDKDKKKDAKKKRFDMKRMLKRYASLVEALLFSRGGAKDKRRDLRQRPYSFSGVSSNWSRGSVGKGGGAEDWRRRGKKRWGEFSAPASMRTSPTNSGLLVAPPNLGSSEESTMEELQNAIQAAITHCKNSMNNSTKGGEGGGGEVQAVVDN